MHGVWVVFTGRLQVVCGCRLWAKEGNEIIYYKEKFLKKDE